PEAGFFDIGVDSLMSVDLKNRLSRHLAIEISPTLIFQNPNISALSNKLIELMFEKLPTPSSPPVRGAPDSKGRSHEDPPETDRETDMAPAESVETDVESAIDSELAALDALLEDRDPPGP
ncbi:MAG: acyl carrier protein, partial [Verrucomicrobiota bacterium]